MNFWMWGLCAGALRRETRLTVYSTRSVDRYFLRSKKLNRRAKIYEVKQLGSSNLAYDALIKMVDV